MAWTAPMTATANSAFTAAQFNTHVRDNLNECAPAKATTAGRWFIAAGTNSIVERAISEQTITTAESTSSTSFTNLATTGPAVTITTGTQAILFLTSQISSNTASTTNLATYAVSGATTVAADDDNALTAEASAASDEFRASTAQLVTGLTAGSNVFTMKYRVSAGTGTFKRRKLAVMAL